MAANQSLSTALNRSERPFSRAFARAVSRAPGEISVPVPTTPGTAGTNARQIAPVPVPRSRTRQLPCRRRSFAATGSAVRQEFPCPAAVRACQAKASAPDPRTGGGRGCGRPARRSSRRTTATWRAIRLRLGQSPRATGDQRGRLQPQQPADQKPRLARRICDAAVGQAPAHAGKRVGNGGGRHCFSPAVRRAGPAGPPGSRRSARRPLRRSRPPSSGRACRASG